jgi:hypothetical protein
VEREAFRLRGLEGEGEGEGSGDGSLFVDFERFDALLVTLVGAGSVSSSSLPTFFAFSFSFLPLRLLPFLFRIAFACLPMCSATASLPSSYSYSIL